MIEYFLFDGGICMLKIILEENLGNMMEINEGSTAVIYRLEDGDVYKKYNYPQSLSGMDLTNTVYNIHALQHIANLSNIEGKTFVKPKGFVTDGKYTLGITMDYVDSPLLKKQSLILRDVAPFEAQVREDIMELSKVFHMHDLNSGSIFFSKEEGFKIVDLDYFDYITRDIAFEQQGNLLYFYTRVIRILYNEAVANLVTYHFKNKGIDYINFEHAQEIIDNYLRKTFFKEENVTRKLTKKSK